MTQPLYNMIDTWNDGGTVFTSIKMTITDTAYAATSYMIDLTTTVAGGYFRVDADGNLAISGYMDFVPTTAPTWQEGRLYYDSGEKTMAYYSEEADVTVNIGQENVLRVQNNSGGLVADGEAVYINGATGGLPTIAKAIATTGDSRVVGIVTHDIEDSSIGYVTTFGIVRSLDTSGFSPGDVLYLDTSVAGNLVNVKPVYPLRVVQIGVCVTSDASNGKVFVDIDQNSAVVAIVKSYTFASRQTSSGVYYQAGFYEAAAADANLTNASATITYGSALCSHPAHVFIVSAGDGATDGSDLVLTVTGTSVNDDGSFILADSEVVVSDALAGSCPTDTYLETSKKFLGTVTYTLTSTGGTTFNFSFNYGISKYEDFNNVDTTIRGMECVGLADASDTGFNIQLLVHNDVGWTYAATGFVAGNTPLLDMNVAHGTKKNIVAGEHFAFKRTGLSTSVGSSSSEGYVIKVTTTVNNAVRYMDSHLTVTVP